MRTRRSQSSSNPVSSAAFANASASRDGHQSVLLHESLEQLDIQPGDTVVDATLGGGGHARALSEALGSKGTLIGFDLDSDAIERAKDGLKDSRCRVHLVETNFRRMSEELMKLDVTQITKVLFDLGWSSYQLDSGRGFSFRSDESLRMTYSKEGGGLIAEKIVNEWGEESLADIIYGWGEERFSRRIARAIVAAREKRPIKTSLELAEIVKGSVSPAYRRGRIHPATRTFQALRIAVNDELGALSEGLKAAWHLLEPGGKIAVVSFHSIEDRVVKQLFAEWEKSGVGKKTTKKPIAPTAEEIRANPRSRSAKLRVISKL